MTDTPHNFTFDRIAGSHSLAARPVNVLVKPRRY